MAKHRPNFALTSDRIFAGKSLEVEQTYSIAIGSAAGDDFASYL